MEKANATIVGRFTPAQTRRALEVCASNQLALWKPKWFSKHTGIPYGALMPFIERYEESDNKLSIASRSIINYLARECNAPRPICLGQYRAFSELIRSIKKLHPALKELVQVSSFTYDTCILCNIRTHQGMYYPSGETDGAYICDSCVDDMYPTT